MSTPPTRTRSPAEKTHVADRRIGTETKASVKTTELIAFVAAVVGVLVAARGADEFGAQEHHSRRPADDRLHGQPRPGQVRQPRLLRRHPRHH